MLAFADIANGGIYVRFHRLVFVLARGLDCFVNLLQRLDAFAVFVVARILEIVLCLFKVLNGMCRMFRFFELSDGSVHLGLRGAADFGAGCGAGDAGAGAGGAAKCGGAERDEEGWDVCFHGDVLGLR